MPENGNGEVTVQVRRGLRVRIEEVDRVRVNDDRVPDNRDLHIQVPQDVKLAVRGVDESGRSPIGSVILRCG